MESLKRAKTWEVSDSEGEETHRQTLSTEDEKGPMTESLDPYCKSTAVSVDMVVDPHSKPEPVSLDSCSKSEMVTSVSLVPADRSCRAPSLSPRRRRKTPEEREEERARAEERRAERERGRVERERVKEEKRQEKQRRKEEAERVKSLKPENCLKTLTVHIHPVLLQDSGCDVLLNTLAALEWSSCIEQHSLTHSISWTRQVLQTDGGGGLVEEDQVLMVLSQREFMAVMTSIKQSLTGGAELVDSVFQPLSDYLNRDLGAVLSLLVTGAQHTQRKGSWDDGDDVCQRSQLGFQDIDIEEVLVYLQLYKNVTVHFLFGWQEVTDHVCAVTKALSKRPFKALCDGTDLGFCVDGSWSGGVRVDGSGRGLAQVWTRQIQQLNRVSTNMALAMSSAYPSPSLLLQAYKEAESEEEQRKLLADLPVRGGAKERRVGPELSNRMHRLMTSQNPQLVLD